MTDRSNRCKGDRFHSFGTQYSVLGPLLSRTSTAMDSVFAVASRESETLQRAGTMVTIFVISLFGTSRPTFWPPVLGKVDPRVEQLYRFLTFPSTPPMFQSHVSCFSLENTSELVSSCQRRSFIFSKMPSNRSTAPTFEKHPRLGIGPGL